MHDAMKRFLNTLKWAGTGLVALVLVTVGVLYGVSEYRLNKTYDVPLTAIAVPHDAVPLPRVSDW